MTTREIAGATVSMDDEGFMTDPSEWNKDIAAAIAAEEGVAELTDAHWKIIDYCRDSAPKLNGNAPTLRQITTGTGVSTKELFALFPKGPAKMAARIAGIPKPKGCI